VALYIVVVNAAAAAASVPGTMPQKKGYRDWDGGGVGAVTGSAWSYRHAVPIVSPPAIGVSSVGNP
jgi:hypothetical protein